MKKNKLIAIIGISLVGNYFMAWNGPIVAYADNTNKKAIVSHNNKEGLKKDVALGLQDTKIQINNWWGTNACDITFDPITKKINVGGFNNYLGHNSNTFTSITLGNPKTGKIVMNANIKGNSNTNVLKDLLNGKTFEYGDVLRIKTDTSQGSVNILSSSNIVKTNGEAKEFLLTKEGLKEVKENLNVKPLEILVGGNVTKGVLQGTTNKNTEVVVTIGKRSFKGVSNNDGEFKISLEDLKGFTNKTNIEVWVKGVLPTFINPVAPKNLGLNNSYFKLKGEELNIAETLRFNPTTMTVEVNGSGFEAQLIDNKTGIVLGTSKTGNFGVFTGANNLNGHSFNYGDIIGIYENEEVYLSDRNVLLINGSNETSLAPKKVQFFEITPKGLEKIQNKSLHIEDALYEGANVNIKGTTKKNTKVKVFYGGSEETVTSNSNGELNINVPSNEINVGSEVRVFLNGENISGKIVKFDKEKFGQDKEINLINNEGFPVINIGFNIIKKQIEATVVPEDMSYAGTFYGNKIEISLIDGDTGKVIRKVKGIKAGERQVFANMINNLSYKDGDIIKIKYNKNFVSADVYNGKKVVSNNTGMVQYFEITSKALVNITDKFIKVNPFDILGDGERTSGVLKGNVNPSQKVIVQVGGKTFKTVSNKSGNFSININYKDGFTQNTNIEVMSEGFMETTINPVVNKTITLNNSSINLYKETGGSSISTNLLEKISFDVENNTFKTINYGTLNGNGSENYLEFNLYTSNKKLISSFSLKNSKDMTENLEAKLNNKKFNYGDIIGLKYNKSLTKPVILNGEKVFGNINGEMEYFKITKKGLEPIYTPLKVVNPIINNNLNIQNSNDISKALNNSIKSINNSQNIDVLKNTKLKEEVLVSTFINTVGLKNLQELYNSNVKNKNFVTWVLNNPRAMEEFLNGPNPEGSSVIQEQTKTSYYSSVKVWADIWNAYENSHSGFNLKLAIATSLVNGVEMTGFPTSRPVGSPVERYNIFETLNEKGEMVDTFKTLDVRELSYVVDSIVPNSQIEELRSIILQNHNNLISNNSLYNIAYTINYNTSNPHTGVSIFGNNFYGPNPTVSDVWYDGGVCGEISRLGVMGEQVFGIPAAQVPQPGHDAFTYYNAENNTWSIGNDIFGWSKSYQADLSGWSNKISTNPAITNYNLLFEKANTEALKESNLYLDMAKLSNGYTEKLQAINKAIKEQPLNLEAWVDKINLYKSNPNTTIEEFTTLRDNLINTFKDYPMPMYDALYLLKPVYIERGTTKEFNNYVMAIKKALETVQNNPQKTIAEMMIAQMPSNGLVPNRENMISNNEIVINNVWQQALGTITFNGVTGKIQVSKGWSEVNPYLSNKEEAFSIGLYSKDGKVIKKVVVKGSEYPENTLYNEFNNLSFSYGDKIIIDYKTSSNIYVKPIITSEGLVSNYRVIGLKTIYIYKDGLSLSKDSKINDGEVTINYKDTKGNMVSKETTVKGPLKTKVAINNLEIPKGYTLEKILYNGEVIYKGDNLINGEYEISKETYQNKVGSIELILNKNIEKINKEPLNKEIQKAKEDLQNKNYTKESKSLLEKQVVLGEKAYNNENLSKEELNNCIKDLENAIEGLKNIPVKKADSKEPIAKDSSSKGPSIKEAPSKITGQDKQSTENGKNKEKNNSVTKNDEKGSLSENPVGNKAEINNAVAKTNNGSLNGKETTLKIQSNNIENNNKNSLRQNGLKTRGENNNLDIQGSEKSNTDNKETENPKDKAESQNLAEKTLNKKINEKNIFVKIGLSILGLLIIIAGILMLAKRRSRRDPGQGTTGN